MLNLAFKVIDTHNNLYIVSQEVEHFYSIKQILDV